MIRELFVINLETPKQLYYKQFKLNYYEMDFSTFTIICKNFNGNY
jgi:hypothetical protein